MILAATSLEYTGHRIEVSIIGFRTTALGRFLRLMQLRFPLYHFQSDAKTKVLFALYPINAGA